MCDGVMVKNGFMPGTRRQRWRCKKCGTSDLQRYEGVRNKHFFRFFIRWLTEGLTIAHAAELAGVSPSTINRAWKQFWFVQVHPQADPYRIYDQIYIDGTYFARGCLLIAVCDDHVITWHWCRRENTHAYMQLLSQMAPPKMVIIDGHRGSIAAVKALWPTTKIQRCTFHIRRNVQAYVTRNPRYSQGCLLNKLAENLTGIKTIEQAIEWQKQLHEFHQLYGTWLNERTYRKDVGAGEIPSFARNNKLWWYTHYRYRSAYKLLERLVQQGHLFAYLDPELNEQTLQSLKSMTNIVEGRNSGIKTFLRRHKGMPAEHQRTLADWYLHLNTHDPDDPVAIAKKQNWGATAYRQACTHTPDENLADQETGRPALYDNHIDSGYTHSVGIRKGQMK